MLSWFFNDHILINNLVENTSRILVYSRLTQIEYKIQGCEISLVFFRYLELALIVKQNSGGTLKWIIKGDEANALHKL